jgi:predicted nucleotidyltransferase
MLERATMSPESAGVSWETARAMVDRLVERFAPERVIVFGSLARGEAGPDSDIDLLVVMPLRGTRRETAVALLRALADFPVPTEVVVLTPSELEATRDLVGAIAYPAVREGRTLHAA